MKVPSERWLRLWQFQTVREDLNFSNLTFLRAQTDRGEFDQRDWAKDQPLSFYSLRKKFFIHKENSGVGKKHLSHIANTLRLAGKHWDTMQIKEIAEAEIEDFFNSLTTVSGKSKKNYQSTLHDFWSWIVRREKRRSGITMPVFPEIKFKMAFRKIVSMEDQAAILDEIKRLTFDTNPRLWLGIKLLSMYPKVRPGEMLKVKERDINLRDNWIVFPDPKERDSKYVILLPEDSELIREIRGPKGLPDMYFFRHVKSKSGVKGGVRFGQRQFRMWWNRACENLGIEGVDLYGGTKHSTVTALGQILTPEQIQRGVTGHASDAFKRYMLPDINDAIQGALAVKKIQSQTDKHLINRLGIKKAAK